MRVVALDLSLTGTGIAVTHDQLGEPRLSCQTVTPGKYPTANIIDHRRLHKTFEAIAAWLAMKPDLVVVEWLPLVKGTGGTALRIAELHGAIKHYLFAKGHRYVDVRPQELKTYATGNGNAKKELVREQVIARYGSLLHVSTYDEADAVAALALTLAAYGQPLTGRDGREIAVPPANAKAVAAVTWPQLDLTEVAS
jgi:crossover junction endodeoxyribonuclease RuvC